MQIAEFVEATSQIEKFFDKDLTDFQRENWYQELKYIDIERYRQIVKQVFRKCKFMPKLADIIEIQEELPYQQKNKKEKQKIDCQKCKGDGVIFYKKIITDGNRKIEYTYVARCTCQNAEDFKYNGTKLNDTKNRSNYYIPSVEELGI